MFCFSCYCDKTSNKSNIEKGRFLEAHSLSVGLSWQGFMVTRYASAARKVTNAAVQLTVPSFFSPWKEPNQRFSHRPL